MPTPTQIQTVQHTSEAEAWCRRANDLHLALDVANDHIDNLQERNAVLIKALESVELRLTQTRLASNIGRESSVRKADFLRGQCESIAQDARIAIRQATSTP